MPGAGATLLATPTFEAAQYWSGPDEVVVG